MQLTRIVVVDYGQVKCDVFGSNILHLVQVIQSFEYSKIF